MAVRANPEIKRYIAPLLERRHDLVLIGRRLVMTPVTHYARCVYFDRSRWKGSLIPVAMVAPLYEGPPEAPPLEGHQLRREKKAWDLLEKGGETELCDALEARALPLIQNVLTPDDFLIYLQNFSPDFVIRKLSESIILLIKGDFQKAKTGLQALVAFYDKLNHDLVASGEPESEIAPLDAARNLFDRLRDDPKALLRTMHEWEAGQVKLLKVERYWQPSPFPCEAPAPQ